MMKMARMVGSVLTSKKTTCPVLLSDVLALEWCSKKQELAFFVDGSCILERDVCIQAFFLVDSVGHVEISIP